MDYKKTKASNNTLTRNTADFVGQTKNIYEAIVIMGKRADQIGNEMKDEISTKLQEFASYNDNLEEIFENREQIEISKFYEKLPKPVLISTEELLNDEIYIRRPDDKEHNQKETGY